MKHKTSFGFSELRSTGGWVLLDDDGLAAGAHVAMDLVADLDPKLSLIPVKMAVDNYTSYVMLWPLKLTV